MVSRNDKACLRGAGRPADGRRSQRVLRCAAAPAAPLHALRHRGDMAGSGAACGGRIDHGRTPAAGRRAGRRGAAGPVRTGQGDHHGRAQYPQAEESAAARGADARSDRRRELSGRLCTRADEDGQLVGDRTGGGEGCRGRGLHREDHAVFRAAGRSDRPRSRDRQVRRRADLLRRFPAKRRAQALERAFRAVGSRSGGREGACQEGRRRGEDRRDPRTAGGVELTAAMIAVQGVSTRRSTGSCVLRGSTLRTAR